MIFLDLVHVINVESNDFHSYAASWFPKALVVDIG
jgi:hypothetical protein